MQRFPVFVRDAMAATGADVTCLPVHELVNGGADDDRHILDAVRGIDAAEMFARNWESAIFFRVAGTNSKLDRRILRQTEGALPVAVEADLIEHASAAVIVIRFEIHTRPDDPLVGEILMAPGSGDARFQVCRLLTLQSRLRWYIGDESFHLLRTQQIPWGPEHRQVFEEILNDATAYDAVVRMTASYDAGAAMAEIASHYELREAVDRPAKPGAGGSGIAEA